MPRAEPSGDRCTHRGWLTTSVVAALAFTLLALVCVSRHEPRLPRELEFDFVPERSAAGRAGPLLTLGSAGSGDFLFVRFIDETRAIFGYDSWGHPRVEMRQPITLTPGGRHSLRIALPFANPLPDTAAATSQGRLSIELDGQRILEGTTHYFTSTAEEIYVGANPLGGTAAEPKLRGALFRPNGTPVRTARDLLPFAGRIRAAAEQAPGKLLVVLALSVLLGRITRCWLVASSAGHAPSNWSQTTLALCRAHRVFIASTALCATAFTAVITFGSFDLTAAEDFGSFYDYQAASLVEGRWDVPRAALGNESFVVAGKDYGYFGPTPAFIRLPWIALGFGFGQLSRGLMLGYFVAALAAAYLLLRLTRRLTSRAATPTTPPSALIDATFLLGIGLGSTLLFLGSRAYVYHEAILCGAACALWSCWFSLLFWETQGARGWRGALLFGLLALHARPPAGLFALGVLGWSCVLLATRAPRTFPSLRRYGAIGLLCVVAVLSFNTVSYAKFGTFDGAPLRFNLLYTPERLARIDGRNFHLVNVPRNACAYFAWPNFRHEPNFPYLFLGFRDPLEGFPRAKIDLAEPLIGLPFSMPGLAGLSLIGLTALFFRRELRGPLAAILLGLLPMTLALFAAIATSQRYGADFCAALITLAAFGLALTESARPLLRNITRALFIAATAWAITLNTAVTFHYQLEVVWGVPNDARARYQKIRARTDALFGLPPPVITPTTAPSP